MEQVEEICEYIVLLNEGRNVLEGKVKDIKDQFKENIFNLEFEGELPSNIHEMAEIVKRKGQSITVKLAEGVDSNDLLRSLIQQDVHITAFHEILPSLNEIFIKQVEKTLKPNIIHE